MPGDQMYRAGCEDATHLGNAFFYVYTHYNGILLVEDAIGQNAQDAWEDCIKLGSLLLLILHLQLPTAYGQSRYNGWAYPSAAVLWQGDATGQPVVLAFEAGIGA